MRETESHWHDLDWLFADRPWWQKVVVLVGTVLLLLWTVGVLRSLG